MITDRIQYAAEVSLTSASVESNKESKTSMEQPAYTKRIKERCIEEAARLVLTWREMWETSKTPKITLKQGAEIVGIAKKSLDDYLFQLRLGVKNGFDFGRFGSGKIGVLRSFNRRMKRKKNQGKSMPGRKKKDEEKNYSSLIKDILTEIRKEKDLEINYHHINNNLIINGKGVDKNEGEMKIWNEDEWLKVYTNREQWFFKNLENDLDFISNNNQIFENNDKESKFLLQDFDQTYYQTYYQVQFGDISDSFSF